MRIGVIVCYLDETGITNSTQPVRKPPTTSVVWIYQGWNATTQHPLSENPSPRPLANVDPWDIAQAYFDTYQPAPRDFSTSGPNADRSNTSIYYNEMMINAIQHYCKMPDFPTYPICTMKIASDTLRGFPSAVCCTVGPEMVNGAYRDTATARASIDTNRLLVRPLVTQVMATVLVVSSLFSLIAFVVNYRSSRHCSASLPPSSARLYIECRSNVSTLHNMCAPTWKQSGLVSATPLPFWVVPTTLSYECITTVLHDLRGKGSARQSCFRSSA